MDITSRQAEAIFGERFDVSSGRTIAFRGRLQHLQRLEFPTGTRTGRGRAAAYGWLQIVQLMVALDLIDLGLAPEVVANRVHRSTHALIRCADLIVASFGSAEALVRAIRKQRCPFGQTQVILTSSGTLSFANADGEAGYLIALAGPDFMRSLTKDPAFAPTAAYIDFGSRLMGVAHILSRRLTIEPIEVAQDLVRWAMHAVHFDEER